jgi:hypothetical protein
MVSVGVRTQTVNGRPGATHVALSYYARLPGLSAFYQMIAELPQPAPQAPSGPPGLIFVRPDQLAVAQRMQKRLAAKGRPTEIITVSQAQEKKVLQQLGHQPAANPTAPSSLVSLAQQQLAQPPVAQAPFAQPPVAPVVSRIPTGSTMPPAAAGRSAMRAVYDATLGRVVRHAVDSYVPPTSRDVKMGLFIGGLRAAIAFPFFLAVGVNPVCTAAIAAIVGTQLTLHNIYFRTMDNFLRSSPIHKAPPADPANATHDERLASEPSPEVHAEQTAPHEPTTRLGKIKDFISDLVGRSLELGSALEITRTFIGLGGGHPMSHFDVMVATLGPAMATTIMHAVRATAKIEPTTNGYVNLNAFVVNIACITFIEAGIGGPAFVIPMLGVHINTALATLLGHDILMTGALKFFPKTVDKLARWEDAFFHALGNNALGRGIRRLGGSRNQLACGKDLEKMGEAPAVTTASR